MLREQQYQLAKRQGASSPSRTLQVRISSTRGEVSQAILDKAFYDPKNPNQSIIEQANGPDRLPENKLLQAQLNLDIMRARGEVTQEQYNQLAVATKAVVAKNWLAHDGKINPDGTISYRNVPVDSKVALGVAYADAKRYWDKETHLSPQEIAQAAKDLAMGVYDYFIGDDIKVLQDPNASLFSKVLAGGSLGANFIPGAWIEKAGLSAIEKVGGKLLRHFRPKRCGKSYWSRQCFIRV